MRIYLDNCALGRLTDDLSQDRTLAEEQAVRRLVQAAESGLHTWVASEMLLYEIAQNPHRTHRAAALDVLAKANEICPITPAILQQAKAATRKGLSLPDAVHLYVAMVAQCDVLFTTDDRFIRQSARLPGIPPRFVRNPAEE